MPSEEGVYELTSGSRVTDVVKFAGGFTDDADKKSVNLAESSGRSSDLPWQELVKRSHQQATHLKQKYSSKWSAARCESAQINLNTATLEELQTISGIGAKRAQDIIDYRDNNGGFSSVDDLKNVSGIGEKTLETKS